MACKLLSDLCPSLELVPPCVLIHVWCTCPQYYTTMYMYMYVCIITESCLIFCWRRESWQLASIHVINRSSLLAVSVCPRTYCAQVRRIMWSVELDCCKLGEYGYHNYKMTQTLNIRMLPLIYDQTYMCVLEHVKWSCIQLCTQLHPPNPWYVRSLAEMLWTKRVVYCLYYYRWAWTRLSPRKLHCTSIAATWVWLTASGALKKGLELALTPSPGCIKAFLELIAWGRGLLPELIPGTRLVRHVLLTHHLTIIVS